MKITVHDQVLKTIQTHGPISSSEIAKLKPELNILSIYGAITELKKSGQIQKNGQKLSMKNTNITLDIAAPAAPQISDLEKALTILETASVLTKTFQLISALGLARASQVLLTVSQLKD